MTSYTSAEAQHFAEQWLPAWTGNRPDFLAGFYSDDAFYRGNEHSVSQYYYAARASAPLRYAAVAAGSRRPDASWRGWLRSLYGTRKLKVRRSRRK